MEEIPTGGLGIPKTVWGEEDEAERDAEPYHHPMLQTLGEERVWHD